MNLSRIVMRYLLRMKAEGEKTFLKVAMVALAKTSGTVITKTMTVQRICVHGEKIIGNMMS